MYVLRRRLNELITGILPTYLLVMDIQQEPRIITRCSLMRTKFNSRLIRERSLPSGRPRRRLLWRLVRIIWRRIWQRSLPVAGLWSRAAPAATCHYHHRARVWSPRRHTSKRRHTPSGRFVSGGRYESRLMAKRAENVMKLLDSLGFSARTL